MSLVEFKICSCRMSLCFFLARVMSLRPLSHVEFKKQQCRPVTNSQCRMSILRNAHVAVSNLGVEGHKGLQTYKYKPFDALGAPGTSITNTCHLMCLMTFWSLGITIVRCIRRIINKKWSLKSILSCFSDCQPVSDLGQYVRPSSARENL